MADPELVAYQQEVEANITQLREVLAAAAVGDFSKQVPIPTEENEFTDLYVGTELLLQAIRDKVAHLEQLNRQLGKQISTQNQ